VFDASLDALAPFGRLVTYGIASREPNTVSSGALMRKSRGVIGFWLMHCLRRPAELVDAPLQELFERAAAGELRVVEGGTYPLSEVRGGHRAPPLAPPGAPHVRQADPRSGEVALGASGPQV
jgi:NADPH2:quinone reductase